LILWARAFAVNIGGDEDMVKFAQKSPHSLSFRSAALSRKECAALLPAASRFLAD